MDAVQTNNPTYYGSAISSLLRVKDKDGIYYTVFPISTTNEVYYDMDNQITLENFLNNKNLDPTVHHVDSLEDINNTELKPEVVRKGDMIAVGGRNIAEAEYLYLVLDNTNFENKDNLLNLGLGGTITKSAVLSASNWAAITSQNMLSATKTSMDADLIEGDLFQYVISDDINYPIADDTDIEIDFPTFLDYQKANIAEIQAYCDHGSNDGNGNSFIVIYASNKPTDDISIDIKFSARR